MSRSIPLTRGLVAIVDEEDYERLAQRKWIATKRGYATRTEHTRYAPGLYRAWCVFMHREIMDAPKGFRVDHVNGNPLDNRRANLRFATQSQNQMNKRKSASVGGVKCSSRFKGVTWQPHRKHWTARIKVNRQATHLGTFTSERDAALAYDRAARERFGEFAVLNFPEPGERGVT